MLNINRKQLLKVSKCIPKVHQTIKVSPKSYGSISMIAVAFIAEQHRQDRISLCQANASAIQEDQERRRRLALEESHRLLVADVVRTKKGFRQFITSKAKQLVRGLKLLRRIIELALLGTPVLILFPLSQHLANHNESTSSNQKLRKKDDSVLARMGVMDGDHANHEKEDANASFLDKLLWRYLRWSIGKAGPTCIKMAQWAATRDDLFPEELCDKLAEFQQEAPPHAWKDTEATFNEAFGIHWAKHLKIAPKDREQPLGSGCVAQVYKGVVDLDGKTQEVALKVLHPNIIEKVNEDLRLLRGAALFLERIFPKLEILGPRRIVDDFGMRLTQQLDLRQEASHLDSFNKNFAGVPEVEFPVPICHENLKSNKKVLIESFIGATPVLEYIEQKEVSVETKIKLSKICLKAIMKMVLLDNMLHGDLHPGNILIREVPKGAPRKREPSAFQRIFGGDGADGLTVVFLDAGLAIDLDDYAHRNMVQVLRAFTERDGRAAAKFAVEASERAVAMEAEKGNPESESVFDFMIETVSSVLVWLKLTGGEVEYKTSEAAKDQQMKDKEKQLENEKNNIKLSPMEAKSQLLEQKKRARLLNLEAFYDGCHECMKAAQESERLTLELGLHMRNMFSLACDYNVRLEPYFVSIAIAVRVMEGIASRLDPDIQLAPLAAQIFAQLPVERQLEAAGLGKAAELTKKAKHEASDVKNSAIKLGRRLTGVSSTNEEGPGFQK